MPEKPAWEHVSVAGYVHRCSCAPAKVAMAIAAFAVMLGTVRPSFLQGDQISAAVHCTACWSSADLCHGTYQPSLTLIMSKTTHRH